MVESGTCRHPLAGRLARQAPLRAEGEPENQGGEGPRPGHRPSPRRPSLRRPMQTRLSRETGEDHLRTHRRHKSRRGGRGGATQSAAGVGGFARRGEKSGARGCHDGEAKVEVDEIPREEGS